MAEWNEIDEALLEDVLELLEAWRGARTPWKREALCRRLQCSDRSLRATIAELRRRGHPIIADAAGGYRFATSSEELRGYIATLQSRVSSLREVIDALEGVGLEEPPLQAAFF